MDKQQISMPLNQENQEAKLPMRNDHYNESTSLDI